MQQLILIPNANCATGYRFIKRTVRLDADGQPYARYNGYKAYLVKRPEGASTTYAVDYFK